MPVCAVCSYEAAETFKFCPECGAAAATSTSERRKVVTVLFCDVVGSTALGESTDPEAVRSLLARYFERMKEIVNRYGGTVEKFIGDAVMAVFGVPVIHEDDALRAVRAAAEMRAALPELGLEGRIGVMTGEVVAGTEERLATGDAVNVAARLEQAARAGEVLVGEPTLTLVRGMVEVEPVESLVLKGKAKPVPAFRLLQVHQAAASRPVTRFVGRKRELALVRDAWERVCTHHRCELFTVVGDPGIGKSRLAEELLTRIEATVVRGSCLPYGDGITYWPVVQLLSQLDLLPEEEAAAGTIRSLLRETEAATSTDEIAWAVRKTLERAALERPLVVVFEDIQWGEEAFLDVIEHVALLSSGAPILLLCLARPELMERRAEWPIALRLGPLDDEDVEELIPKRLFENARVRIARAAGGNPLFIEEMLAIAGGAKGELLVPPTLQALLAARLDQLEPTERSVLQLGSIEGEVFHRGAVQALAAGRIQVTPRLAALVRKGLIRPDAPQFRGEDGFRFHHLMIRDAAYDALPKVSRADLHAQFASWLEQQGTNLIELDEILGYHLEQTCGYRSELGLPDDDRVAEAATHRLTAAGARAQRRSDYSGAASLYGRAAALAPPDKIDLALETGLVDALFWSGRGDDAVRRADSLAERAAAAGNRVVELCARIQAGIVRSWLEPQGAAETLAELAEQALPVFEQANDDLALHTVHHAIGLTAHMRGRFDSALHAYELAANHARQAGLPDDLLAWRADFLFAGTAPVSRMLSWLDENEPSGGHDHWLRSYRAAGLAMLGRFDEARAILAEARAALAERGGGVQLATITGIASATVELLAGDPAAAAELGKEGCNLLDEMGEKGIQSTAAAQLAQALYTLDHLEEADRWAARAAELGATDDAPTQILWRQVKAKVLARGGRHREAERLARDAIALSDETDMLDAQGDSRTDLAAVLLLAGRTDEATIALRQALERYERKENVVMAQRARARLAELRLSKTATKRV